jgi:hypothetical protein
MAELTLVAWRDIPAQVIAKAGRRTAKRQLSDRFQEAIDRAAMRHGLRETDAYLAAWHRVPLGSCSDDLEAEAEAASARIEAQHPEDRLRALVANGGRDTASLDHGSPPP